MKIHACGISVAIDGMKTLGIKGRVLKNIPITKKGNEYITCSFEKNIINMWKIIAIMIIIYKY